jgi:RNA polymerase sigma-70 factor (ECF subfamily)
MSSCGRRRARGVYQAALTRANHTQKEETKKAAVEALRKFARERICNNPKNGGAARRAQGWNGTEPNCFRLVCCSMELSICPKPDALILTAPEPPWRRAVTLQENGHPPSDRELDQQLVERVQHGDKQAFGLLVAKYQRKLHRLLARLVRDPVEVEDLAQETFIKAYRALASFRGESAFYTWLYRIGLNTAKNHLVAQGRRVPAANGVDVVEAESFEGGERLHDLNTPERQLMTRQIATTVQEAMAALPDELREAITLRELEGLSYEDIAQAMECPIGTVRSRIFRAREAIAARLRPLLGTGADERW